MRKALIGMFLIWSAASAGFAETDLTAPPWKHTLALSPGAIGLLRESVERSSIVESLLQQLEATEVVVYVTDVMSGAPGGPPSYLTYLSNDEKARYLLVRIARWGTSPSPHRPSSRSI